MKKLFDSISQVSIASECDKNRIKLETESILKEHLNNQRCNFECCVLFLKEYQNYAKKNGNNIHEIHILLGENNECIGCSINNKKGGELTEIMRRHIEKNNFHLIHNHPSNGSLSTSDWKTLAAHLRLQMTAVNDFGSYFTGSVKSKNNISDFEKNKENFDKIIKTLHLEHTDYINYMYGTGTPANIYQYIENIEKWLNHKLGLMLCSAGYSTYTHKIKTGDTVNTDKTKYLKEPWFKKTIDLINNWK